MPGADVAIVKNFLVTFGPIPQTFADEYNAKDTLLNNNDIKYEYWPISWASPLFVSYDGPLISVHDACSSLTS